MDSIVSRFSDLMGSRAIDMSPLAESGSNRKYYRIKDLSGSREVVAVYNEDVAENEAFISIDEALLRGGIRVPQIIAVSDDKKAYLQENLGDTSLYDLIKSHRDALDDTALAASLNMLLDDAMRQLARLHWHASTYIDFSHCYPVESMTARDIMWDLNYCKYCFLKPSYVSFDEARLQDDFDALCANILTAVDAQPSRVFMYRDFQSRNVMVRDDKTWFIDFQGGRSGLFLYDVVSFLWQGRAGFSGDERQRLIDVYFDEAQELSHDIARDRFISMLPDVLLFRSLQVLGAYGFRGNFEGKKTFQSSIPAVLQNVAEISSLLQDRYPEIVSIMERLVQKYITEPSEIVLMDENTFDGLTVTVTSFSYKKGYPVDLSGNGGGFVFDCRAIHNPGRYDEYKQLTGMDDPVKRFLEEDGEILPFIEHVKGLVSQSVDKYVKRGFKSLQVAFGCTGGQHRSVYSAEAIAHWLGERNDVRVHLVHREQGVDRYLE